MSPLQNRVVVVTGAAGNAGPAVVEELLAAGAQVVLAGRDPDRLHAVAAGTSAPDRAHSAPVDLQDEAATLAWGHQIAQEYGGIDGLVHLVGGWRGGSGIVAADLADYDWLHENLVRTLQHATRAVHDPIKASPVGRIVIVSSTAMERPTAGNAAYLSAKAGAEMWMRALAHSLRESDAAAVVLRIRALLTPAMRAADPEAAFAGYTPDSQLATAVVDLFGVPAATLNGQVSDVLPRIL